MEDTARLIRCPFCSSLRIRELGELYASKWIAELGKAPHEVQVSINQCEDCRRYFEGTTDNDS